MLKETLIFTGGAVVGAAIAYLVTKRYYEKRADEEIEATKDFYREYVSQDQVLSGTVAYSGDSTELKGVVSKDIFERKEEETYKEIAGQYTGSRYYKKPDLATYVETVHPELNIEILDPNSLDADDPTYEQATLNYYENDGVLSDIGEQIVDIDTTIGAEALNHFGEFGEEDIVRVRNKKLGMDYEVIRIHAGYVDYN